MSANPLCAAIASGVAPSTAGMSGDACAESSSSTTSVNPLWHAA